MKIFFDTNVYVAEALLGAGAKRIIDATVAASWRIYVNSYVASEAQRVIRDKLGYSRRVAFLARVRILRRATEIEAPASRHSVPADSADDAILQAALAAGVDYLVTNDEDLLALNPYEGLRIVSMNAFQEFLEDQGLLKIGI
jgi:putative PIN family toxin of toxin-antitoxin system